MAIHVTCDGMKRREFLRVSVFGGAGVALAGRPARAKAAPFWERAPSRSGIFIKLAGGPSHLDTFDMKPNAPAEVRGPFRPIQTNVPGIRFCEHMPKLAKWADKFAILRGVTHTFGAHRLGSDYVASGTRPGFSAEHPGYGTIVAEHARGASPPGVPPAVTISGNSRRWGFLDVEFASFGSDAARGVTVSLDAKRRFAPRADALLTSKRFREAVHLTRESCLFAEPFGQEVFGSGCLLACRLIESGVRFVTLSQGGWDTHQDSFRKLQESLLPQLDTALSALLNGLEQKGLLESTAMFVSGEFGRTPKINNRCAGGGRDHHPRCMFMLMAGGSVRGGQVIGQSDDTGTLPAADALSPDDAAASFYHNLGIDPTKPYRTAAAGPRAIVPNGRVIRQLFA